MKPERGSIPCHTASHQVVGAALVAAATMSEGHTGGSTQDVAFLAFTALDTGQGWTVFWGA